MIINSLKTNIKSKKLFFTAVTSISTVFFHIMNSAVAQNPTARNVSLDCNLNIVDFYYSENIESSDGKYRKNQLLTLKNPATLDKKSSKLFVQEVIQSVTNSVSKKNNESSLPTAEINYSTFEGIPAEYQDTVEKNSLITSSRGQYGHAEISIKVSKQSTPIKFLVPLADEVNKGPIEASSILSKSSKREVYGNVAKGTSDSNYIETSIMLNLKMKCSYPDKK